MAAIAIDDLHERLRPVVAARFPAGSRLGGVDVMEDGHAGLTFGFTVDAPPGAADSTQAFVIKLAPPGVRRSGNQPGNVLFEDGKLVAILDWELSGIGDQRIDLG